MPGVNVGRVGPTYNPDDIAGSGAKSTRCTYHPDTSVLAGAEWLNWLRQHGVTTLMALDNDTHFWGAPQEWKNGVERARDSYMHNVDVWQVCNEPDAGWIPGPDCPSLEERAAAHPSSWVMTPNDLSEHLWIARQVLGQNAVIIGPGLSSGHPEWAADVDWGPVDMIACHPYAKDAGSPELLGLIAAYSAFGWPVAATEYDAITPGMHTWMAKNLQAAWAFCWSNAMHAGHGLIERPECYAEFKEANQINKPEEPIMALPIKVFQEMWQSHMGDAAEFHPQFGVEKFWMEHYKELGACVSKQEIRQGKNAYRSFVGGVIVWHDDTGASIAA